MFYDVCSWLSRLTIEGQSGTFVIFWSLLRHVNEDVSFGHENPSSEKKKYYTQVGGKGGRPKVEGVRATQNGGPCQSIWSLFVTLYGDAFPTCNIIMDRHRPGVISESTTHTIKMKKHPRSHIQAQGRPVLGEGTVAVYRMKIYFCMITKGKMRDKHRNKF